MAEGVEKSLAWMEKYLKIITKDSELIPFKANRMQQHLFKKIVERKLARPDDPVYLCIMKARQMGCSTFLEGMGFHQVFNNPFTNALVVAHESDPAENLFRMTRNYYQYLPNEMRFTGEQSQRGEEKDKARPGRKRIEFLDPDHNSRFLVLTANNPNAGSSFTFQFCHLSEVAKWAENKIEDAWVSIQAAFAKRAGSFLAMESSPYGGMGGLFADTFFKAEAGENDYISCFFPWWFDIEYRRWDKKEYPSNLNKEEESIVKCMIKDKLDEENILAALAWRRYTIANECEGKVKLFRREYPSNPIEGFQAHTKRVFNGEIINLWLNEVKDPMLVGDIKKNGQVTKDFTRSYCEYVPPVSSGKYIVGVDCASGSTLNDDGDFSAVVVLEQRSGEVVATFRERIKPHDFGRKVAAIGKRYGSGLVIVESNPGGHGTSVLNALVDEGYPNLHVDRAEGTFTEREQDRYGFQVNKRTKPLIIDELDDAINNKLITVWDKVLLTELYEYREDDKGKLTAPKGKHDDLCMALALANWASRNKQTIAVKPQPDFIVDDVTGEFWVKPENEKGQKTYDPVATKLEEYDDVYDTYAT